MIKEKSNNKTIAKNTILLYLRMMVLMIVSLFTSRVVLNSLGFVDYGIYNVVGGVVAMLQFLNVGMSGASQRFITFDLGKGNLANLKNTFCTSVITHYSIALIVVVAMESVGIWFLNCRLNIPPERLFAANWVFQCSILTFALSVMAVPYNACIIAHERMGAFAYISILETVSKLGIAFAILYSTIDKLIVYATLIALVQFSIRLIYVVYCKKNFEECTFKYHFDKPLFKQMFAFAGWGCLGNMGFSTKDQLSNILLNLFFGTTVNAARGIATQISGVISSFASNFTMAMNPQVTKLYAAGELEKSRKLVYAGSKYAFFLLSIIVVPFLTNEHYIMVLWLGKIPEYTDVFVFIILANALIYSMAHTTANAIQTTGHVKWLQIGLATILLLEIPIAYVILKFGGNPYQAMIPSVFTTLLSVVFRMWLLVRLVDGYSMKVHLFNIVRCIFVFIVSVSLSIYIRTLLPENLFSFAFTTIVSFILIVCMIYLLGLNTEERTFVKAKCISVLNNKIKR